MVSRNEPVPSTVKATLRNDYNDDVDNVEIPVVNGAISSVAFEKLGTLMYDPGYQNTAVVRSAISYIDGEAGILEYRGYRIEELAEKSSFLEVAHLLIYGELPGSLAILNEWQEKIMRHTFVHSKLTEMLGTFHYDAHPMGIFIT